MEFARKQLEKYGWSDGKGLGRHENGIAEPLRPQLQRSKAGVGHDPAAEYNDHWWSTLYDKAAANVEIDGETKITTKDPDAVEISSKTWRINKKTKSDSNPGGYADNFVKTSVLTSGGNKVERIRDDESSNDDDQVRGPVLTDEELFKACGGRTAHKGARHGLHAIGKLARIEQQEKNLLNLPQYKGYSQAKTTDDEDGNMKKKKNKQSPVENTMFDVDPVKDKSKRKKKKPCIRNSGEEGRTEHHMTVATEKRNKEDHVPESMKPDERQKEEVNNDFNDMNVKKNKKRNIAVIDVVDESNEAIGNVRDNIKEKKGKKNKKYKIEGIDSGSIKVTDESNETIPDVSDDFKDMKVKKNKKNKMEAMHSEAIAVTDESDEVIAIMSYDVIANMIDDFKDMKGKKNKKNKVKEIDSEAIQVIDESNEAIDNVSDDTKDVKVKKSKENKIEEIDSEAIEVTDESNDAIANVSDDFKDMKVKNSKKNKIEVIESEVTVIMDEDYETNENRESRKKVKKNKRKRDVEEKITDIAENTEEDKPKKKKVKKNKNVV